MKLLYLLFLFLSQNPPPIPQLQQPIPMYPAVPLLLECKVPSGGGPTATFFWSQIYGPAPAAIINERSSITNITLIAPGTYVIRCSVTNGPLTNFDDYYLTVSNSYREAKPTPNGLSVVIDTLPQIGAQDAIKPTITSVKTITLAAPAGVDVLTNLVPIPSFAVTLSFTIVASDNIGVTYANLIVDNYMVDSISATTSGMPPTLYVRWNERTIKPGVHNFILRIYDSVGNFDEKKWTMTR